MSDGQNKNMGLKKTDNISPKTQHFLYTKFSFIEDHNQTKHPFQIRILHKKRYSKPPNKHPYKSIHNTTKVPYKQFHTQIHTKIPYISIPDFFFTLNFSSSLLLIFCFLFSLLSFSILLFSLPLRKSPTKMGYFGS